MKKNIYLSFLMLIFLFITAERSLACSCVVSPGSLKDQVRMAYSGADAVFSGEVLEIKQSPTDSNSFLVTFKVDNSWKGEAATEITITTATESAMCGYNFEAGKKYLVYASGNKDKLSAYNCSRTAIFSNKGDVKYLGKLSRKKIGK